MNFFMSTRIGGLLHAEECGRQDPALRQLRRTVRADPATARASPPTPPAYCAAVARRPISDVNARAGLTPIASCSVRLRVTWASSSPTMRALLDDMR
jgi:hypothetical protein